MSEVPYHKNLPYGDEAILSAAMASEVPENRICIMCLSVIETMAFRNTGVCGENCRKDRDNDHSRNHAIIEAPIGGERV